MEKFYTLDDIDVYKKRVLLRADLNVPVNDGKITDTTRIDRLETTIKELKNKKAIIILISHFGRPGNKFDKKYSLRQVLPYLKKFGHVHFADDCIGEKANSVISRANYGDIVLLENTRFHPQEKENNDIFSKKLADLGDVYINDAFSASHRAHSSTEGVSHFIEDKAVGRFMQIELESLSSIFSGNKRPLIAVIGGSKVSTKIEVLKNLIKKVDKIIIAGAMANTFLISKGYNIGSSIYEKDMMLVAKNILESAKRSGIKIILPIDFVVSNKIDKNAKTKTLEKDIQKKDMILDIGSKTISEFKKHLKNAKMIVWNGPLGVFEYEPFSKGSFEIAKFVSDLSKNHGVVSIAGGGDTLALISGANANNFSYLCSAGGAFLEWIEGKDLPGVSALKKDTFHLNISSF